MGRENEKRLFHLAARQLGVVSGRDLAACNVSRKWIWRRIETGEWVRLHRGVFQLGANTPTLDQREMAAILAAGDGVVLSHLSAARRLGLDLPRDASVHVTIPASRRARISGVKVWRSRNLGERDVTKRGPFRLTHLARTVIDLAQLLDDDWLRAVIDSALRQRRSHLSWISRLLSRQAKGHHGAERLRALLDSYQNEGEIPDSVLESLAVGIGQATGHEPELHWCVLDGPQLVAEVDLAWPEVQVCVQLDGWMHHGTRAAFSSDRAVDRKLTRMGWLVLRYTWKDVTVGRERMINELADTYAGRAGLLPDSA